MPRWITAWVFIVLCTGQPGLAQQIKVGDRTVQVHGFFSQGFVKSTSNNWLTMDTSEGSGAMTDMGLNVSSQVTDKFRIGAQVYDRNLGQLGQWHPSLDWAVADYRFNNWFGVRGGKVKTTLGLYNDAQDLDCLRVFALLPQGVYPTDLRDPTLAHTGGDIYGSVALPRRFGELSYTAYAGHRSDSIYSGYPYLIKRYGVYFTRLTALQYGGDVRWNTPVKGLLLGVSRLNQEMNGVGKVGYPITPPGVTIPYRVSTTTNWTNQFYGEYRWHKILLNAEYQRFFVRIPAMPGSDLASSIHSWYVMGGYHVSKHLEVGSYYSHYTAIDVSTGRISAFVPTSTDSSLPSNHVYDKVIAARWDVDRFLYFKVEGHFMAGYGIGPEPNGFYPQQNPNGFESNTNALVIKTGFRF